MPVSEAQRFALHRELKNALGDDVADTRMEHLPPTGWSDVARKTDIERVEKRLTSAITVGIGFALAMIALQVQIMLSVANL
jgi:hypothetical protein